MPVRGVILAIVVSSAFIIGAIYFGSKADDEISDAIKAIQEEEEISSFQPIPLSEFVKGFKEDWTSYKNEQHAKSLPKNLRIVFNRNVRDVVSSMSGEGCTVFLERVDHRYDILLRNMSCDLDRNDNLRGHGRLSIDTSFSLGDVPAFIRLDKVILFSDEGS